MDLDYSSARLARPPRRIRKSSDDTRDSLFIEWLGREITVGKGNRTRSEYRPPAPLRLRDSFAAIPWRRSARFAAGMGELHSGHCSLFFDKAENVRKHRDVVVRPNPQILRTDPRFRQYRRRLGEDNRRSAHSSAAQMYEMPVVRVSR